MFTSGFMAESVPLIFLVSVFFFTLVLSLVSNVTCVSMGDGQLSEKINLHCGHLSDNISGHLSDTISIDPKIYVDN